MSGRVPRKKEIGHAAGTALRRFYSYGDNYSPEEDSSDLERWSGHKIGMAIVSPVFFRENILKVEKIINYLWVSHRLELFDSSGSKTMVHCPYCNSQTMIENSRMDFTCKSCKMRFSKTRCNNTNAHGKPIDLWWIKHNDDNYVNDDKVMQYYGGSLLERLSWIDSITCNCATTTSMIDKENSRYKVKTVCPHCGKYLGDY